MEARIQEGSHLGLQPVSGAVDLDQFSSTYPQYWGWREEEDPIDTLYKSGRPEMLSLVFGVPKEKFNRYLRHWYSDWDEETEEFRSRRFREKHVSRSIAVLIANYEQMWISWQVLGSMT